MNGNINPLLGAELKKNANWFLALGIGLVIVGSLAIYFAYASTIFSVLYVGFLLIALGVFEAIKAFKMRLWRTFFLHIALSILYLFIGGFIIMYPTTNAIMLTLIMAAFFVASGLLRLFFALSHRAPHMPLLALSGILSIILGILIWQQWPYSGLWAIGLLVGIDAVFTGFSWIMLAVAARK